MSSLFLIVFSLPTRAHENAEFSAAHASSSTSLFFFFFFFPSFTLSHTSFNCCTCASATFCVFVFLCLSVPLSLSSFLPFWSLVHCSLSISFPPSLFLSLSLSLSVSHPASVIWRLTRLTSAASLNWLAVWAHFSLPQLAARCGRKLSAAPAPITI